MKNLLIAHRLPGAASHGPSRSLRTWAFAGCAALTTIVFLPLSFGAPAGGQSDEKLQQILKRFPEADTNHDGKLTPEEFSAFRQSRAGERRTTTRPTTAPTTAPAANAPASPGATDVASSPVKTTPATKGRLLLEEKFEGDAMPKGWTHKAGGLRVADGVLHASQDRQAGSLGLFNCEVPMQDAIIQIDFKFAGCRGLNVSVNPSQGELKKHGHLYSIMITPVMWNITEHNDKNDRSSVSKALAQAAAKFDQGQWYTLVIENKGPEVIARIEGKEPLRAASNDFAVKKPGIEFRVLGRDNEEVHFDNLRVWELK